MSKPSYFSLFIKDLPGTLGVHTEYVGTIRESLKDKSLPVSAREIINSQIEEIDQYLVSIENIHKKFIMTMVGHTMQAEIEKQAYELFPDSTPNSSKIGFIRIKIIFEWLSSFWKIADNSWNAIFSTMKIFSTYTETSNLYETIYTNILKDIFELNIDTKTLLSKIEKTFSCKIVGTSPSDKQLMISNIIYDEEKNYDYSTIFPNVDSDEFRKPALKNDPVKDNKKLEDEYFFTTIRGTKEWNRNDSYILYLKIKDLKEEEQKFYSSSFVILNPAENNNINLAAALVRKNSGYSAATKYNQMVSTLIDFAMANLISKDFSDISDDTNAFLYHIGPIVLWNIIQEDMIRRDFGFCYLTDNRNNLIKLLPEYIIKKHIIDYWTEKFYDLKSSQVDSYIIYSKGVSVVKESYKFLFDQAAATRKRGVQDSLTLEQYLVENTGKFFGYRRAHVYKRFINDSLWGHLSEVNSIELVNKFAKR
jgi:hypothetical protein